MASGSFLSLSQFLACRKLHYIQWILVCVTVVASRKLSCINLDDFLTADNGQFKSWAAGQLIYLSCVQWESVGSIIAVLATSSKKQLDERLPAFVGRQGQACWQIVASSAFSWSSSYFLVKAFLPFLVFNLSQYPLWVVIEGSFFCFLTFHLT